VLSPYRVLDLTNENGFLCGKILADLGADVIKVEPPGGDPARMIGPFCKDIPDPEGSLFWLAYNTSKRGITLSLETQDGREILKELIRTTDFVIESFPPGYMDDLGLGYSSLRKINNRLIMTSITSFGQGGPYKDYKSSDLIAMAMGGLMYSIGDSDRAPLRFSLEQVYPQAGIQAAMATLIAHNYRRTSGEGQHIDVSIQECVTSMLEHRYHFLEYGEEGSDRRRGQRVMRGGGKTAPLHIWPCRDGYVCWRVFTAAQGSKTKALVEWMEEEGMGEKVNQVDWAAVDFEKLSQEQLGGWEKEFGKFFLLHTKTELQREAMKRDIMMFPVNTIEDLLKDEQLAVRDFWVEVKHAEISCTLTFPGAPYKLEQPLWRISQRAPLIGEHNLEIYQGELGFSRGELVMLKQAGII